MNNWQKTLMRTPTGLDFTVSFEQCPDGDHSIMLSVFDTSDLPYLRAIARDDIAVHYRNIDHPGKRTVLSWIKRQMLARIHALKVSSEHWHRIAEGKGIGA